MLEQFDPSGLSEDVQAELARLVSEEDKPSPDSVPANEDKSPQGEDGKSAVVTEDSPPKWVEALVTGIRETQTEQTRAMTEAVRTLQGQVRQALGDGQRKPEPKKLDLDGVDTEEPSVAALVRLLQNLSTDVEGLKGSAAVSEVTTREQAERNNWMSYLEGVAEMNDLKWGEVEPKLRRVPTNELAVTGAKVMAEAVKEARVAANPPKDQDEDESVDVQVAKGLKEALMGAGLWDTIRIMARGGTKDADSDLAKLENMNSSGGVLDQTEIERIGAKYE